MTGTEKSDRSGGPSCEARTDRYVILNGGGWVSNAKSMAMNEAAEHLAAYGGREGPFTAHLIGPAVTFETREEKLERLVDLIVLHDGPIGAAYDLASELLASREATLTPEQIKRFEGAADRGLSANREKNLLTLLTNVTVAADRLIQQWAESDDDVKHALWKSLGSAVQAAEETVYPLPSEAGQ